MTTTTILSIIVTFCASLFLFRFFNSLMRGVPSKESDLKRYSGNTLTVLASHSIPFERWVRHTLQERGERHTTLFLLKHDDKYRKSDELIYCYTSKKFEIGEQVRIEFTPSRLLNYYLPGGLVTVDLMSESASY